MFDIEEFIEHHGVKGQKWGVRKPRGDRSAFRKRAAAGPNPKHLSDDELRKAVARMQLEKQFTDLSKANNRSSKSAGSKFAQDVLRDVGKQKVREGLVAGFGVLATALFVARKASGN